MTLARIRRRALSALEWLLALFVFCMIACGVVIAVLMLIR